MPEYDFRAPDGSIKTAVFSMKDAPSIGATVELDGVPCVRLPSNHQANTNLLKDRYPCVSRALPKWAPGFKHDSAGRPILQNSKSVDRFCKQNGYMRAADE